MGRTPPFRALLLIRRINRKSRIKKKLSPRSNSCLIFFQLYSLKSVHKVPTGPNFQATNLPHKSFIVKTRPIAVPPLSPHSQNPTTGFDKSAFLLALYIHGKNFCKIQQFISSDNIVPSLQSYYYDQFKSTPSHTSWRLWLKKFQIIGEKVFVDNLLDIINCQSFFTNKEQAVIHSEKRKSDLAKLVLAWRDTFGLKRLLQTLDIEILHEATKVRSLKDIYTDGRRFESVSGERERTLGGRCGQPRKKQNATVRKSLREEANEICDAPKEIYQVERQYAEGKMRNAFMVAAAKWVASGAVHKEYLAPDIVCSIRKAEADVSDVFLEALKQAHGRYLAALSTSKDESARRLKECKDLAIRLSYFFAGAARESLSEVILKIVKVGIAYAFADAPRCLSFLTCAVINFASKLPKAALYDILKNLQERTRNVNIDKDSSCWRSYLTFVDTLREKYLEKGENQSIISGEREGTLGRSCGQPRKKQNSTVWKSLSEEEYEICVAPKEKYQLGEDEDAPQIQKLASRSARASRGENRRKEEKLRNSCI